MKQTTKLPQDQSQQQIVPADSSLASSPETSRSPFLSRRHCSCKMKCQPPSADWKELPTGKASYYHGRAGRRAGQALGGQSKGVCTRVCTEFRGQRASPSLLPKGKGYWPVSLINQEPHAAQTCRSSRASQCRAGTGSQGQLLTLAPQSLCVGALVGHPLKVFIAF